MQAHGLELGEEGGVVDLNASYVEDERFIECLAVEQRCIKAVGAGLVPALIQGHPQEVPLPKV